MKQTVDDTERGLLACVVAETRRILRNDAGTNEDLAVGKSDDIRRHWIAEKLKVHLRNGPIGKDGRVDVFQSGQRRLGRSDRRKAGRHSIFDHGPDQFQVEQNASLPVSDLTKASHKIELLQGYLNAEAFGVPSEIGLKHCVRTGWPASAAYAADFCSPRTVIAEDSFSSRFAGYAIRACNMLTRVKRKLSAIFRISSKVRGASSS